MSFSICTFQIPVDRRRALTTKTITKVQINSNSYRGAEAKRKKRKKHLLLLVVASTSKVVQVLKIVVARWRSIWRPFSAQKKTSKFELIHEAVACIEFEFT